ncbi:hypothetical protein [Bosea sp. CRIB-10]|uniref:hypothetical protein n=1 Tax=Bosea sp. CRIB-10 TaxID=378404 RepID=UPI001587CF38|nr:hypothetical protein [Bosea sp. CRIB-10]
MLIGTSPDQRLTCARTPSSRRASHVLSPATCSVLIAEPSRFIDRRQRAGAIRKPAAQEPALNRLLRIGHKHRLIFEESTNRRARITAKFGQNLINFGLTCRFIDNYPPAELPWEELLQSRPTAERATLTLPAACPRCWWSLHERRFNVDRFERLRRMIASCVKRRISPKEIIMKRFQ